MHTRLILGCAWTENQ